MADAAEPGQPGERIQGGKPEPGVGTAERNDGGRGLRGTAGADRDRRRRDELWRRDDAADPVQKRAGEIPPEVRNGGTKKTLSASSIVSTLHWRDCSFSDDLSPDEFSATGGHQSFALRSSPRVPSNPEIWKIFLIPAAILRSPCVYTGVPGNNRDGK